VEVDFIHPPLGAETEQFNLITASGELPDIMEYNWLSYPGGPEKAMADNLVVKLNDVLAKNAPNLTAYLRANPDVDKQVKTDSGSYYSFPFIRGDPFLMNSQGPQLREDWLKELNLEVPTTYDEWYTVLTAFKQNKSSGAPLAFGSGYLFDTPIFVYGFKTDRGFYVGDDKRVHYGAIEPAYKDYLALLAKWYQEGLLDPDIAALTGTQVATKITNGSAGAAIGYVNSGMGIWLDAGRASNPNYSLVGAPYPVLRKGDKAVLGFSDWAYNSTSTAIISSCKNIDAAAKLLDYGYGKEGTLLFNYGIEGVSYAMINNYPTYTPLVTQNPDGWSIGHAIAAYARSVYGGCFVQEVPYMEQYMRFPQQREAVNLWMANDSVFAHKLPPVTPSQEESSEFARIVNEINTYSNEMMTKFVLGTEDLNNFSTFVETIKRMGIDRAIEIQNAALARYNSR
jgi:putative aldouronate transport system substrate-binding protein